MAGAAGVTVAGGVFAWSFAGGVAPPCRAAALRRARPTRRAGRLGGSGAVVIEAFEAAAGKAAADETLETAQVAVFVGTNETERIADGVGPSGAADAVHIIFVGHREIVIDDVGN